MTVATIALKIVGEYTMHCGGCARTVTPALKGVPGVLKVDADHRTQLVEMTLNMDEARIEVVTETLAQLGYETVSAETA